MSFDDVWREVKNLPETAKIQIPNVLFEATKQWLGRQSLEDVAAIVTVVIDEVNHGSVVPLNESIQKRL